MANDLQTIDHLDVEGRRVLLRSDLDVPLWRADPAGPARVADDSRIRAALTSIDELRRRGARVVLISDLGRPRGHDAAFSMLPVADRLARLTGAAVPLAPAVTGPQVRELAERLAPGEMLMLENARFEPGETRSDPALELALAELADLYVGDAFAAAHRAYASNEGVARLLPCAAGRLLEHEVRALSAITECPERPLVAVLGGARLSDKIGMLRRLLGLADVLCIGGGMCFPMLAARGHTVGESLCSIDDLELARMVLADAAAVGCRVELPEDFLLARWDEQETGMATRALDGVDVPAGWTGLDIGPRTAERVAAEIAAGATILWAGAMGRLELAPFAGGTRAIAGAVAKARATTIAAGGRSVQALRSYGLEGHVSHVSTGGRATLEFLEGRQLPGVQVLLRTPVLPASPASRF